VFDAVAAEAAQRWAEKLDQENAMYHCTGIECGQCGENLATHADANLLQTTNQATQMWYDEVSRPGYNFDRPGWDNNPGTEHFT
jgi:hypothetical protein